jgi:hypothetical protein
MESDDALGFFDFFDEDEFALTPPAVLVESDESRAVVADAGPCAQSFSGWSDSDDEVVDGAVPDVKVDAGPCAQIHSVSGWSDSDDDIIISEPSIIDDVLRQMSPTQQKRRVGRPKKLSFSRVGGEMLGLTGNGTLHVAVGSLPEPASAAFTLEQFGSLSELQRVAAVVLDQRLLAVALDQRLLQLSVTDLPGIAAQAQCDLRRISDCCMVNVWLDTYKD